MTREEKIKKIFEEAQRQIFDVLNETEESFVNLDATANKILSDAFKAKTLLADSNNIDEVRYGMLDYIPNETVIELYTSCMNWYTTGELEENSKYGRFCTDMSKVLSTNVEDELTNNVDTIIFKYKQINVNDSRPIN